MNANGIKIAINRCIAGGLSMGWISDKEKAAIDSYIAAAPLPAVGQQGAPVKTEYIECCRHVDCCRCRGHGAYYRLLEPVTPPLVRQDAGSADCNQLQNPTIVCLKVWPTKGVTILTPALTEEASKLPPGEYELVVRRVGS